MNQFYHHKTSVLLSGNMLNSISQLAGIFRFKDLCHKKWGINWQQKKIPSRSREEMRQFASGIHRYFLTVKTWQDFNSSGLLSTLQCVFLYQTYAFALFSPLKTLSYPQRTFSPIIKSLLASFLQLLRSFFHFNSNSCLTLPYTSKYAWITRHLKESIFVTLSTKLHLKNIILS